MKKLSILLACAFLLAPANAQEWQAETDCPLQKAFAAVPEDVRIFHAHVSFLAHPYLGGRLPGTPGMEISRQYIEDHFKKAGLKPAFGGDSMLGANTSYRQAFQIGARQGVSGQMLEIAGVPLAAGTDYRALPTGGSGEIEGDIVFAGYGIGRGPEGWRGWEEGASLEGKIAMVFRFEPMNEDGASRWGRNGRMSRYGQMRRKMRDLGRLNPAAIIIVNPPGSADPRANGLMDASPTRVRGRGGNQVPVIMVTKDAAARIVAAGDPEKRSLMDLRKLADAGGAMIEMKASAKVGVELTTESMMAENVGGLLPGKGKLADQLVVVGGHIDHLGMGSFGSRDAQFRGTRVHPGADDNATGAAAIIMMAETLVKEYAAMGEGANARSVLFIGFDAEEQGLLGARAYLEMPITARENHALMINFDMIGRLTEGKISVQGLDSAKGLKDILKPVLDNSPLEIVDQQIIPASDHWPFYSAEIPVLFSICHSLRSHPDYHTSRDTFERINATDGAKAVKLYDAFLKTIALHPENLEWQRGRGPGRRR